MQIDYRLTLDYTRDGVAVGRTEYRKTRTGALARAADLATEHGTTVTVAARIEFAYSLARVSGEWHRFAKVTPDDVIDVGDLAAVAAKIRQRAEELAAVANDLDMHYVLMPEPWGLDLPRTP